jgi:ribosomal protein S12 methylthiotransferase accessory factor
MTVEEAEVGAYMEAIELAWAEPQRSILKSRIVPARELGDGTARPEVWTDFLPMIPIAADTPVAAVEMTNLRDGRTWLVPAERVLFPVLPGEGGGQFGSEGNGLCSGNSLAEATLHGLCEVLERDVMSMTFSMNKDTRRIANASLPAHLRAIAERIDRLGFDLYVRSTRNVFDLPYFVAGVIDRALPDHAHRGDGMHPDATIAVTRAVCEAFQSRLSDIHGGRDDLTLHRAPDDKPVEKPPAFRRFYAALGTGATVDFASIPDASAAARDIPSATRLLVDRLAAQGLHDILIAELAPPDLGVHIVRVVVPRLEFSVGMPGRIGKRLREAHAAWTARHAAT